MTLRAENVSLRLGAHQALAAVSLAVAPGKVTALVGPNGAGKSSLLRVLSGEVAPSAGRVVLDSQPLHLFHALELARLRSLMGQSALIAFDFLVEEVLAMGWLGRPADLQPALRNLVTRCGLGHLLGRPFNSLSGGERQRVQFARALLQIWRCGQAQAEPQARPDFPGGYDRPVAGEGREARYLLLDEPTANLDLNHELLVLRLARCASEDNVGVLVVLHDLNLAARFADHAALLADGILVCAGAPDRVFTSETLSRVYATEVCVERHGRLGRLVVHT